MIRPHFEYDSADVAYCIGAAEQALDGALELRARVGGRDDLFDLVEMREGRHSVAMSGTLTEIGTFLDGARWATETQGRDARASD